MSMDLVRITPGLVNGGADNQHLFISEMGEVDYATLTKEAFAAKVFAADAKVSYVQEFSDIEVSKEKKEVTGLWQENKEYRVSQKGDIGDIDATIYVTSDEWDTYKGYFDNNTMLCIGMEEVNDDGEFVVRVGMAAQLSKCTLKNVGKDNEFLQVGITITPAGSLVDLKGVEAA